MDESRTCTNRPWIVGYIVGVRVARDRVRRGAGSFDERAVDILVGYLAIGMLVGARLVYVFVYDGATYAAHPIDLRNLTWWLVVSRRGARHDGGSRPAMIACGLVALMIVYRANAPR